MPFLLLFHFSSSWNEGTEGADAVGNVGASFPANMDNSQAQSFYYGGMYFNIFLTKTCSMSNIFQLRFAELSSFCKT